MQSDENKRILSQNIKRFRDAKGVTNQQICDDLDFRYTTYMDWINAVTYPRIGKIEAMAQYFGCAKSDLIEAKNEDSEKPVIPDGLTEDQRALLEFARTLPEDKASLALRLLQSIVEAE